MKRVPSPIVKTREELIYLLCEAAEIEHQLLLIYLFAAFSLKGRPDEGGMDEQQLEKVLSWKKRITHIAVEEMLHLAMVSNMLTAIGGAPHLRRPNLPQCHPRYYPKGFKMDLLPFSEKSLKRFVAYEHPSNKNFHPEEFHMSVNEALSQQGENAGSPTASGDPALTSTINEMVPVTPEDIPFKTIHELYNAILTGFRILSSGKDGEKALFVVPAHAQLHSSKNLRLFKELKFLSGLKEVEKTIEIILEQGEGNLGHTSQGHYQKFVEILNEFLDEEKRCRESNMVFSPVRNVLENPNTHQPVDADPVKIIDEPFTKEVASLFNAVYETTLEIMLRTFAHEGENADEVATLGNSFIALMFSVIGPLGELLTQLPAGSKYPGKNAGPSFECFRNTHFLPHKKAAWIIFTELLDEQTIYSKSLSAKCPAIPAAFQILREVSAKLEKINGEMKKHLVQ